MKLLIVTSLLLVSTFSWGHGGEDHSKDTPKVKKISPDEELKQKYKKINEQYIKSVKSVFKKSCFDCHGNKTNYPWYYKVPGVKQLIDHDVKEAKKHLDFSKDFPFVSHETPIKDLNAIMNTIGNETMPPLRYRVMHRNKKITRAEILEVKRWIEESLLLLNDS